MKGEYVKAEFKKSIKAMKKRIKNDIQSLTDFYNGDLVAAKEYLEMAYQRLDKYVPETD